MASEIPWSEAPSTGARARQPHERAGQLLAARVQQREVVEPGVAAGGRRERRLVQDEQVLAARAHGGGVALARVQLQPDRVLVEADGAVEVRDGEVDGAEAQRRGERPDHGRSASLDRRGERVDVLRARVVRAHPAHLAGVLVPRVEAPVGLQALGDAGREHGEDDVGLHALGDPHALDALQRGRQPRRHRVRVPRRAPPQLVRRAAPRTARRRSASSTRAASTACAGRAAPRSSPSPSSTIASPSISPAFVPPKETTSAPTSVVIARSGTSSAAAALASRAPSTCSRIPCACAWSASARSSLGRVERAELGRLRDGDDAGLDRVLVADPHDPRLDELRRELAVGRRRRAAA